MSSTFVSRTQPVDIYSKARVSGTPAAFSVILPEDACRTAMDEVGIEIEVTSIQMLNCVTPVQSSNDSWLMLDTHTGAMTKCTLPHVNVSIRGMAKIVQAALPAGWSVSADESTNKLSFTSPSTIQTPVQFYFNDPSLQVSANSFMGFSKLALPTFGANTTIVSDLPCNVGGPATVMVGIDLPTPCQAINLFGQTIGSTVVQKVPLCCPFMSLMHHRDTSGTWAIQMGPLNLSQLTITLHTEELFPLEMNLDWSLTMKCSYLKNSPLLQMVSLLSNLDEYSEIQFLKTEWSDSDRQKRKKIAEAAHRVLENL